MKYEITTLFDGGHHIVKGGEWIRTGDIPKPAPCSCEWCRIMPRRLGYGDCPNSERALRTERRRLTQLADTFIATDPETGVDVFARLQEIDTALIEGKKP